MTNQPDSKENDVREILMTLSTMLSANLVRGIHDIAAICGVPVRVQLVLEHPDSPHETLIDERIEPRDA